MTDWKLDGTLYRAEQARLQFALPIIGPDVEQSATWVVADTVRRSGSTNETCSAAVHTNEGQHNAAILSEDTVDNRIIHQYA